MINSVDIRQVLSKYDMDKGNKILQMLPSIPRVSFELVQIHSRQQEIQHYDDC